MSYELDIQKTERLAMVKCWGMAELQRPVGLAGTTIYKIKIGQHKASARIVGKIPALSAVIRRRLSRNKKKPPALGTWRRQRKEVYLLWLIISRQKGQGKRKAFL